jgi:hypothetical protein
MAIGAPNKPSLPPFPQLAQEEKQLCLRSMDLRSMDPTESSKTGQLLSAEKDVQERHFPFLDLKQSVQHVDLALWSEQILLLTRQLEEVRKWRIGGAGMETLLPKQHKRQDIMVWGAIPQHTQSSSAYCSNRSKLSWQISTPGCTHSDKRLMAYRRQSKEQRRRSSPFSFALHTMLVIEGRGIAPEGRWFLHLRMNRCCRRYRI